MRTNFSKKIRTGIPGFDSLLSGGLREGRTVILSGPPGAGKSICGMQFLCAGARDFDEAGIYVTLSESNEEIINNFSMFDWDIQSLIEDGKILIIDARPFKMEEGFVALDGSLYRGETLPFMHLTQLILSRMKRIHAKRLVIDSLTVLSMQYDNQFYKRQGLQGMIHALENQNCTSILISEEMPRDGRSPQEWVIASGAILLHHLKRDDTIERAIQIVKMRGMPHSDQIHPIRLGKDGIQISHPTRIIK